QVSEALGGNQWFLRLLRDEGQVAERLPPRLRFPPRRAPAPPPSPPGPPPQLPAPSQYTAALLTRTPEALQLLAHDAQLEPRSASALAGAWRQAAAPAPDPQGGIRVLRGARRQEL